MPGLKAQQPTTGTWMPKRPRYLASNGSNGGYMLPYVIPSWRGLIFNNSRPDFATFQPSYYFTMKYQPPALSYLSATLKNPTNQP